MVQRTVQINDHEEWLSTIEGVIWVKKLDRRGDQIEEPVKAGGKIRLLPEERQMNQEAVAEEYLDPFVNGHLVPLKLVDTADDFDQLKDNPNHLTESDMTKLLENPKTLQAKLSEVTNPATLQRILTLANGPESEVAVKHVRTIEARLSEVLHPDVDDQATVVEIEQIGGGSKAVATRAPKSKAPRNPTMGRR